MGYNQNRENFNMNKELFESNWKQIRSQTTAWWSLMSDHDLVIVDKAEVKYDKYVTMLRVKYGYTNDQAKKEINKRMAAYETAPKK
jgi:predicted metal-dependent HD superfamily phosphohydrolase